jgi:hypothetical protein
MTTRSALVQVAGRTAAALVLLLTTIASPAFSQEADEAVAGRVVDAANRPIGTAEMIPDVAIQVNFTYSIRLWLNDGRVRVVRPQSGSRSTTIKCSFTEYTYDAGNPKDRSRWEETGSGTASLQMPPIGDVRRISVSLAMTKKIVGEEEQTVTAEPRTVVIVID